MAGPVLKLGMAEIFIAVADVITAIALFLPAIYGYSTPSGPNGYMTVAASPNFLQLAFESRFWYLSLILVGLLVGLVSFFRVGAFEGWKAPALVLAALLLTYVPSFVFGMDYTNNPQLYLNGKVVSFLTTAAPGGNVLSIGSLFYFGGLLLVFMRD